MDEFEVPAQENIAKIMVAIGSGLANVERTRLRLMAELRFVRQVCEHPETEELNPMGRWPFRQCKICGKRW